MLAWCVILLMLFEIAWIENENTHPKIIKLWEVWVAAVVAAAVEDTN